MRWWPMWSAIPSSCRGTPPRGCARARPARRLDRDWRGSGDFVQGLPRTLWQPRDALARTKRIDIEYLDGPFRYLNRCGRSGPRGRAAMSISSLISSFATRSCKRSSASCSTKRCAGSSARSKPARRRFTAPPEGASAGQALCQQLPTRDRARHGAPPRGHVRRIRRFPSASCVPCVQDRNRRGPRV